MRDYRIKNAALACFVLAGLLSAFTPAHATETQIATGSVQVPWFGPSDEINTALGNGVIGYSFPVPSQFAGKHFRLTAPGTDQLMVDQQGFKMYAVDLDVYFYSVAGWDQGDGTIRHWDNEAGVTPGPESGTIPSGTDRAFVIISAFSPTAHGVSFTFYAGS